MLKRLAAIALLVAACAPGAPTPVPSESLIPPAAETFNPSPTLNASPGVTPSVTSAPSPRPTRPPTKAGWYIHGQELRYADGTLWFLVAYCEAMTPPSRDELMMRLREHCGEAEWRQFPADVWWQYTLGSRLPDGAGAGGPAVPD